MSVCPFSEQLRRLQQAQGTYSVLLLVTIGVPSIFSTYWFHFYVIMLYMCINTNCVLVLLHVTMGVPSVCSISSIYRLMLKVCINTNCVLELFMH